MPNITGVGFIALLSTEFLSALINWFALLFNP